MSIEKIKELLKSFEGSENVISEITTLVSNEKDTFLEKKRELSKENQSLRASRNELKDKFISIGLDHTLDIKDELARITAGSSKEDLATLQQELGTLKLNNKDLTEQNGLFQQKAEKGKLARVESALTKAFTEKGAINFGMAVSHLASNKSVFIDENDEVVIKIDGNVTTFDKGKDIFIDSLKENGSLTIGNAQNGGSGGGGGGGNSNENTPTTLLESLGM